MMMARACAPADGTVNPDRARRAPDLPPLYIAHRRSARRAGRKTIAQHTSRDNAQDGGGRG